ncbi:unnamed protein product [Brassica napus]|uniref:(rape) hypothetical protein n=1 Tax=Brassica napus TaxID=3708 RepID=A0A816I4K1_BRANA|nr:unnamed protein product [Brassica napus]
MEIWVSNTIELPNALSWNSKLSATQLFKYHFQNEVSRAAIELRGSCYFLGVQLYIKLGQALNIPPDILSSAAT